MKLLWLLIILVPVGLYGQNVVEKVKLSDSDLICPGLALEQPKPQTFRIACGRSNRTGSPLIIVDNQVYNKSLDKLNVQDIKSISILKDPAASAIWGSQASDGVIVIEMIKRDSVKLVKKETIKKIDTATIEPASKFAIAPNPASNKFNIYIENNDDDLNVSILNTQGQVIKKWNRLNASSKQQGFDISDIPAGLYLVLVQTGNRKRAEQLLVTR